MTFMNRVFAITYPFNNIRDSIMVKRKQNSRFESGKPAAVSGRNGPTADNPFAPRRGVMISTNSGRNDSTALRKCAKKKASASKADGEESLSPREAQRLLHELRVHQIELETQNEELRRSQVELGASRERYFDLYDMAPVGYITVSEKGLIMEANLTAATLLGVARNALDRQPMTRFIIKEDQDIYHLQREKLFKTDAPQVCELRMRRGNDLQFWALVESTAAKGAEGADVCRAVLSDITARKQAEDSLRRSSEHNATLLREIHHRVKNSLSMIIGILHLQDEASGEENPMTREQAESLEGRIRSIALLHEHLYQTGKFSKVSIGHYFKSIINYAITYHGRSDISVNISACSVELSLETALPCGLILNELLSNTFKHAFSDGRKGSVRVGFATDTGNAVDDNGRDRWIFSFEDDGSGCGESALERKGGTGWKIINLLCHQLGAETSYMESPDFRFSIRFKELVYAKRV